jgi:hypothetical protein
MYLSSFNQGFAPIFFGGAILLFPFLAALPHALGQVEEIRTGFLFTKAMRSQATAIRMRDERAAMLSKHRLAAHMI